ncbi:hypothetical protein V8C44DRAFT_195819 [Trichoderma aethiopicum]
MAGRHTPRWHHRLLMQRSLFLSSQLGIHLDKVLLVATAWSWSSSYSCLSRRCISLTNDGRMRPAEGKCEKRRIAASRHRCELVIGKAEGHSTPGDCTGIRISQLPSAIGDYSAIQNATLMDAPARVPFPSSSSRAGRPMARCLVRSKNYDYAAAMHCI